MNRREFLRAAGAGVALSTLGNYAPAFAQPKPKRVGLIGPGWYGKCDLFRLIQVAPVEVVSLCDVDKQMLAQAAELVSTRQFDVGLVELPLSRPAIAIEPLDPAPSMAVIPAGHRLAAKRQISLRDLDGERMILLSQHSFVRYQMDDEFSKLGVAPHVVIETPSSSIACALVAAGAGITLVSRWTAEPFAGPQVVVRPVKEALASRSAIIFPEPGARFSLAEAFANDLREEVRHANRR